MSIEKIFLYVIGTLLLGTVFFVTDCSMGENEELRAEVVDKVYEPERTYTVTQYRKVGDIRVPYQETRTDDEDWMITYRGYTKDGEPFTKTYEETEAFYNSVEFGDVFYDKLTVSYGRFTGWEYYRK